MLCMTLWSGPLLALWLHGGSNLRVMMLRFSKKYIQLVIDCSDKRSVEAEGTTCGYPMIEWS